MTRLDAQIRGLLLGGALGDCIGNEVESGYFGVTDDTELTLATCEAVVETGAVSPAAIAARFARGYVAQEFHGLGAATLGAVKALTRGGHWALVGMRGEYAAGNGAAMRVAPLGFVLDPLRASDRETLRDITRITHHSEEAYCGALAVVLAVAFAGDFAGYELVGSIAAAVPDSVTKDRLTALSTHRPVTLADATRWTGRSGWVADTVPLALVACALFESTNPEGWLYELASHSDDPDTVCSIAGQIAGAINCDVWPSTTLQRVPMRTAIVEVAANYAAFVRDHLRP